MNREKTQRSQGKASFFQVNALSAFFRDWFCQQRSERTDPIGFALIVVKVPLSRLTDFEPGFPAKRPGFHIIKQACLLPMIIL
jgi:hypothetical protein